MAAMIKVTLAELLKTRGHSLYWLHKETGLAYTTLWRLKEGKTQHYPNDVLDKVCTALKCQISDFIVHTDEQKSKGKTKR